MTYRQFFRTLAIFAVSFGIMATFDVMSAKGINWVFDLVTAFAIAGFILIIDVPLSAKRRREAEEKAKRSKKPKTKAGKRAVAAAIEQMKQEEAAKKESQSDGKNDAGKDKK